MNDFQEKLQEYARLLVRVGLNVYPGQNLVISAPVADAGTSTPPMFTIAARHVPSKSAVVTSVRAVPGSK